MKNITEDFHSEEIEDIIYTPPKWIVRWGVSIISFSLLLILGCLSLINSPELIKTSLVITSEDSLGNFYGKMQLPQYNLGKIHPNQTVLLKFDSFPYQEFGVLRGVIQQVSDKGDSQNNFYAIVKIEAEQNKVLLKIGMKANSEIILKNISLLKQISKSFLVNEK